MTKHFFYYRKPAREAVEPLDDLGMKGLLKEHGEMEEKLNDFFCFCVC